MVNLYPPIIHGEEEEEADSLDDACEELHEACKGWGTDEDKLIEVLGSKSPTQRFIIANRYPELYDGKELDDVMKSECGKGDFGFALRLLAMKSDDAEVKLVRECTHGIGTKDHILYTIICGRSNAEIDHLKKIWYNTYESDLGVMLSSELSGDFERLVFNCLQGVEEEYDEEVHTDEKAEEDAEKFYDAGQGTWGTDERGLFNILCCSPAEHLENINSSYVDKYGYSLSKAIEKELDGLIQEAAIYHLNMKLKPFETMAGQIKKACAGFGSDEFALTSHIIRFQQVLSDVNAAHEEMYEKTIVDRIESEVGGDYLKLLRTIVEYSI